MGRTLVLDAMGVLYASADDVAELLVPYLKAKGSSAPLEAIEDAYRRASLGELTAADFWAECGVAGEASDDEYCLLHQLTPGMADPLAELHGDGWRLAVLSNDVSEWSRILRERFELDRWIETWVFSGEIGARKPDPRAYQILLDRLGLPPAGEVFFADDRPANVSAGIAAGLSATLFSTCEDLRRALGL